MPVRRLLVDNKKRNVVSDYSPFVCDRAADNVDDELVGTERMALEQALIMVGRWQQPLQPPLAFAMRQQELFEEKNHADIDKLEMIGHWRPARLLSHMYLFLRILFGWLHADVVAFGRPLAVAASHTLIVAGVAVR